MIVKVTAWIAPTWSQLPPLARFLLPAWILTMVSVPILGWIWGARAQQRGIVAGVLLQSATVVAILSATWSPGRTLTTALGIVGMGWAAEYVGSRTGIPFGRYEYTDRLQPQLGKVPVVIPIAWLMMLPASWAVGMSAAEGLHTSIGIAASALAFTAWDLFLDPQMVAWGLWRWSPPAGHRPRYFGIPWINYAGWFAVSAVITGLLYPAATAAADLPRDPLILIYGITWFLELFGQLFFWSLRGPAVAGGIGMGLCLLAGVIRSW